MNARSLRVGAALVGVAALLVAQTPESAAKSGRRRSHNKIWRDVSLPFSEIFSVPKGATLVRATAKVKGEASVSVSLTNAETQRPRCYPVIVKTWSSNLTRTGVCEALTAIDPPRTQWRLTVTASNPPTAVGPVLIEGEDVDQAKSVTVEFKSKPLTGLASRLKLSYLSMPKYKMHETEDLTIESFDGTQLHAELTRPKTPIKVPTVVVSSPYFAGPGPYSPDLVNDWGPRGYAILSVDVRGFNESGGCVEVWGYNEQRDQKEIVKWAARQRWNNGKVALVGKSYVGTTPLEAAVQAPKPLKAIIAIAPVVTAYEDWHFGGVPNGESLLSPAVAYQAVGGSQPEPGPSDPLASIINAANGFCDPALTARANDPRAIYNEFYIERDFAARAEKIDAPVLYSHGYEDSNVKISVADEFFNDLKAPHLGLFGHWDHIWPPRPDAELLFLAWLDQYLKGRRVGLARLPNAIVENNRGRERHFEQWPTPKAKTVEFYPDFEKGRLLASAKRSETALLLDSSGLAPDDGPVDPLLRLERRLKAPLEIAGTAALRMRGTLAGAKNAHVSAFLFDETKNTKELITYGMFNLAHRRGHDKYEPVLPTEMLDVKLPFLTTDHVFDRGHRLVLEIRAARPMDSALVSPSEPGVLTFQGGAEGTRFVAPKLRP
ncbi:MAG: CocE/NonD family hydrolase [Actinomycetota bacterium]|nr:CocE/NonD family hydrolase [Actinomycetota bacterium]